MEKIEKKSKSKAKDKADKTLEIRVTFTKAQRELYDYVKSHSSAAGFLKDLAIREKQREQFYMEERARLLATQQNMQGYYMQGYAPTGIPVSSVTTIGNVTIPVQEQQPQQQVQQPQPNESESEYNFDPSELGLDLPDDDLPDD